MEKNINEERMLEVMKSLEESHEIYKDSTKEVNQEKITEENERLKSLISKETNSDIKENYYIAGNFGTGGRGKTVNSILDDYQNNPIVKTPKVAPSNLKPDEALEVCIKRVLKSGTPINNISFYDEINWNMMNLGFPAVNEIDIKNAILLMVGE